MRLGWFHLQRSCRLPLWETVWGWTCKWNGVVAVVWGTQPLQAWLGRDELVWLRKPRAGIGVWACVAELEAQQLEVIGVELTVCPGGNLEADNLAPAMRGLRHCC